MRDETKAADKCLASRTGTQPVFMVEARVSLGEPLDIGGMILTKEWRHVVFPQATVGVHPGPHLPPGVTDYPGQFVDFEAAEALAAWVRAGVTRNGGGITHRMTGVETRLVEVEWRYSYTATRQREGPAQSSLMHYAAFNHLPKTEAQS